MKIFVPQERRPLERRVAATPETVERMRRSGWTVTVAPGAGVAARFEDSDYQRAGAVIDGSPDAWSQADVVLKVAPLAAAEPPQPAEIELLRRRSTLLGLLDPYNESDTVRRLADLEVTALSLELIPRVTRAQTMDALSSQASIGGYRAVVLAASRLGRYFPLMMTAAGTIPPSRVVVMGAGVAGLQAVATARRLGAVVEVSDIRPEVKEQVESLGGRFIDLPLDAGDGSGSGGYAREMGDDFLQRQRRILTEHVAEADVVITTAQVPGKRAPLLLDREMFAAMKKGAVVVDLAAPQGGNCELTKPGQEIDVDGVLVLGPMNLPATMAHDASILYARNVLSLLEHLCPSTGEEESRELAIDREDEIVAGALVTHGGEIVHPAFAQQPSEVTS